MSLTARMVETYRALRGAGFHHELKGVHELLEKTVAACLSIRQDLDKTLDIIQALKKGSGAAAEQIKLYEAVLVEIGDAASNAEVAGKRLLGEGALEFDLQDPTDPIWHKQISPLSLDVGVGGLDLPPADIIKEAVIQGFDEVERDLARSIKMADHAVSHFSDLLDSVAGRMAKISNARIMNIHVDPEVVNETEEIAKIVIYAVVLALFAKSFFYQPFNIPSGSMKGTLLEGDYIFVSKLSYGYSAKSAFYGLPLFEGRLFASQPRRGDVIVFKLPRDVRSNYVKRLMGLPGDKVQIVGGVVYINDQLVERKKSGQFLDHERGQFIGTMDEYHETLPSGRRYTVLDETSFHHMDNWGPHIVPDGEFFFMGDNRDNSQDSRYLFDVGFIPFENLVGRAEFIFFSVDGSARFWEIWKWPMAIRFSRIFDGIN